MSDAPDLLRSLSPEKRALLQREIARRSKRSDVRVIVARPAGDPPAVSLAQERLWVLDQIYPGRATYNATLTMRFVGEIDTDALHRAVDLVVSRHEAIRTVIERGATGRPEARLLPADVGCCWHHERFAGSEAELGQVLHRLASEPFDLSRDVLLRAHLFQLDIGDIGTPQSAQPAPESVLMFVTHHIASDGWSRGALFDELTEAYNAYRDGREPQLPALPIQYGDYARWQRGLLEAGHYDRVLDFWREEIIGADLVLELPTDLSRSGEASFLGTRIGFADDELGESFRALGRQAAATPFMTYLALTSAMCHALTGQTQFLLGSPSANREAPETARLIGFFVDTIILRVRLEDDPDFVTVLARSRDAVLRSLGNPVPLDLLVETIRPKRSEGRNPLFQVNYRMQGAPPPVPAFEGTEGSRMFTDVGASRFDLAFGFIDGPGPLRGYLEYNVALFREQTMQLWIDAMLSVMRQIVADPGMRLSQLTAAVVAQVQSARRAAELELTTPAARTNPIGRRIRR